MRNRLHALQRILATVLILQTAGTPLAWSLPTQTTVLSATAFSTPHFSQTLPGGRVRFQEIIANKPLLIQIEDVHSNPSAQKNISRILETLIAQYGVDTIVAEGATQDASLEFLRTLAPLAKRKSVAGQFLFDAKLTGAEYLSLASDLNFSIKPAEEAALYRKNVRLYAEVVGLQTQALRDAETRLRYLESLKRQFYPTDLTEFDSFLKRFENRQENFTDYRVRLVDLCRRYQVSLLGDTQLQLLLKLLEKEKQMDWKGAPNAEVYSQYFKEFEAIDLEKLIQEMEDVEDRLFRRVLSEAGAESIYEKVIFFRSFNHLAQLEMRSGDLREFLSAKEAVQKEGSTWISSSMRHLIARAVYFYHLAHKRDRVFLNHVQKNRGTQPVVLIAGGYHTEHLRSLTRANGFSFIGITPQVESETNRQRYEERLLEPFGFSEPKITVSGNSESDWSVAPAAAFAAPGRLEEIIFGLTGAHLGARLAGSGVYGPQEIYMVKPSRSVYGIFYEINAHMKMANQADSALAVKQWENVVNTLQDLGISVNPYPQRGGVPDMVFAANAGFIDQERKIFIPAHFTHDERKEEVPHNSVDLRNLGYRTEDPIDPNLSWEGEGDMLLVANAKNGKPRLFGGYGHRSEIKAHKQVAKFLGKGVTVLELVDDRFYHLDTCFFPLSDGETVIYFPGAFSPKGIEKILKHVKHPIAVSEEDAKYFVCNGVSIGRNIVVNKASDALKAKLAHEGWRVLETPMSEFLKSGGSVKCCVLTLQSALPAFPAKSERVSSRQFKMTRTEGARLATSLDTTDVATSGTMNHMYYKLQTSPRISNDTEFSSRYTKLSFSDLAQSLVVTAVGRDAENADAVNQKINQLSETPQWKEWAALQGSDLNDLKIYLLEHAPNSKESAAPHLLTTRGNDFQIAFSKTNQGKEKVIYMTRAAFLDLDNEDVIRLLKNQFRVAQARYAAWNAKESYPVGEFKGAQALLDQFRALPIVKEDMMASHQWEDELNNAYRLDPEKLSSFVEGLSQAVLEFPNFSPALTNAERAQKFRWAVQHSDWHSAVHLWGLVTYELDRLSSDAGAANYMAFLETHGANAARVHLEAVLDRYVSENGVYNLEPEEWGQAVGEVRVVKNPEDVAGEFAKAFKEKNKNILWVVPYLPDRCDEIPGLGLIVSVAGNRHAIDMAKEQCIPLAIVPNAVKLLKSFNGKTCFFRVGQEARDVEFRLAEESHQNLPRTRPLLKIQVPAARTDGPLVLFSKDVDENFIGFMGPKAAEIGRFKNAGIPVPEGFSLTFAFWKAFKEKSGIQPKLDALLDQIVIEKTPEGPRCVMSPAELENILSQIRTLIIETPMPADLRDLIYESSKALAPNSKVLEDKHFETVIFQVKQTLASLYNDVPVKTRIRLNLSLKDAMHSVFVQKPIQARYAGNMYTADTVDYSRNVIVVMASHGQGAAVVSGIGQPARAVIEKINGVPFKDGFQPESWVDDMGVIDDPDSFFYTRSSSNLEDLPGLLMPGAYDSFPEPSAEGPIFIRPVPSDKPNMRKETILSPGLLLRLKEFAEKIESLDGYYRPQDIEWALDTSGNIFILQARQQKVEGDAAEKVIDDQITLRLGVLDYAALSELREAYQNAPRTGDISVLVRALSTEKSPFELMDKKGQPLPALAQRQVAASYLSKLADNDDFLKIVSAADVERISRFFKIQAKNRMDFGVSVPLLAFLRKVAHARDHDVAIRNTVGGLFESLGQIDLKPLLHTFKFEVAKGLIEFGNPELAAKTLQNFSSQNIGKFPGIGDLAIRTIELLPFELAEGLLLKYTADEKLPKWLRAYARHVINRMKADERPRATAAVSIGSRELVSAASGARLASTLVDIRTGYAAMQFRLGEFQNPDAQFLQMPVDVLMDLDLLEHRYSADFVHLLALRVPHVLKRDPKLRLGVSGRRAAEFLASIPADEIEKVRGQIFVNSDLPLVKDAVTVKTLRANLPGNFRRFFVGDLNRGVTNPDVFLDLQISLGRAGEISVSNPRFMAWVTRFEILTGIKAKSPVEFAKLIRGDIQDGARLPEIIEQYAYQPMAVAVDAIYRAYELMTRMALQAA